MDAINQSKLYSPEDLHLMRAAQEGRLPGKNRVEELKNFARLSGVKRIGIAHCITFQKDAEVLMQRLADEFEVVIIDCKIGKIASADLLGDLSKGISCNPAGQADYLAMSQTDLNVSFGLCMGHDIVFNQKSKAMVTTLVVKDREHKHNPYKEFLP